MRSRQKLSQGPVPRVRLQISQESRPRDSLQTRSGREQGTFHEGWWVPHLAELREACQTMLDRNLWPAGPPSPAPVPLPLAVHMNSGATTWCLQISRHKSSLFLTTYTSPSGLHTQASQGFPAGSPTQLHIASTLFLYFVLFICFCFWKLGEILDHQLLLCFACLQNKHHIDDTKSYCQLSKYPSPLGLWPQQPPWLTLLWLLFLSRTPDNTLSCIFTAWSLWWLGSYPQITFLSLPFQSAWFPLCCTDLFNSCHSPYSTCFVHGLKHVHILFPATQQSSQICAAFSFCLSL